MSDKDGQANNSLIPIGQVVAPGDEALRLDPSAKVLRLGSGLRQDGQAIVATRAGRLRSAKGNKFWIEGSQKRYVAADNDAVIGIVTDKHGETFTVDLGCAFPAVLPVLSFEGATRRNRPNIQVGDVVYARVVKTGRDMDPEISCVDDSGRASGFGAVTGGYVFSCSTGLARALLARPTCAVLAALGESIAFEIAVGMNGRVWVDAPRPSATVLVANAILNAEFLSAVQARLMVKKLVQRAE